jgi:outer membrane lipoprotein LolB
VKPRWLWCLFATVVLAACAPAPVRGPMPARSVDSIPRTWSFEGRLAVSNGRDGGSGRIRWEQDGEFFTITLRAPISGQSWQLSGDGSHARLVGIRPHPVLGTSARELLRRELGWALPAGEMHTWLFGSGFGARAKLRAGDDGALAEVVDSGWNITYRAWTETDGMPLPGRIVAKKAPYQVRLAIQRWTLGDDTDR